MVAEGDSSVLPLVYIQLTASFEVFSVGFEKMRQCRRIMSLKCLFKGVP